MPCTSAAQKQQVFAPAEDPVFTPSFFTPYEAAAHSTLLLIAHARSELSALLPGEDVCAVTYRLKTPQSIRGKLVKKGLPPSAAAAGAALRDIAGLRVVLSSVSAVYRFADLLISAPGAQCIGVHDYIAEPKKSGYRSLHVLLNIPVTFLGESLMVPVEIQLRTVPMDLWATIEHGVCYKPVK
ncbi:MAG: hypothetical protein IJ337_03705 [Clostridia bacterium]|nr:hypothetical protein [Clostridia bacterium]